MNDLMYFIPIIGLIYLVRVLKVLVINFLADLALNLSLRYE